MERYELGRAAGELGVPFDDRRVHRRHCVIYRASAPAGPAAEKAPGG